MRYGVIWHPASRNLGDDLQALAAGRLLPRVDVALDGERLDEAPAGAEEETVTLLSGSAAEDDALTTALCLMDLPDLLDFINGGADGREVMLVCYRDGCDRYEVVTNLAPSRVELLDPAYVLASRIDSSGEVVYTGTLFDP